MTAESDSSSTRPTVRRLIDGAAAAAWDLEALPWDTAVEWRTLEIPDSVCLSARLPSFLKMTAAQRRRLKQREMASHLSALRCGEQRATNLVAETVLLWPDEGDEERWFMGTLLADEAKHAAALERYLSRKLRARYAPPVEMEAVFAQLSAARDRELNLLVGQVVLEGAAASLLTALIVGLNEPLLRSLLGKVMKDEARHMAFAYLVAKPPQGKRAAARLRRMEDVLFDAAYAGAASLLAGQVWREAGFAPAEVRGVAVDALAQRGVLRFYSHSVTHQLRRRGFPADRLERRLERQLEDRLRGAS